MRWLFVFWSQRVDARRAMRQEKSRATGDSVWKLEGVFAEDVAGQPRDATQRKRDAARDAFVLCGCSPYHVAAFARRFRAVRNVCLAHLGLARVLGSRVCRYRSHCWAADRCACSHCCECEVCRKADAAPGVACAVLSLAAPALAGAAWGRQRWQQAIQYARTAIVELPQGAHIGSARQRPGVARGARHPAFWLVTLLGARIFCGMGTRGSPRKSMMLRESCKSTRKVPCSSQPSPMRSSPQPRRRHSIAHTMTAQQGAAQGLCGAADLSERMPVASGRLHTRKSDVAPRKGFLRQKRGASKFSIPWPSDT
ncbi:hypothetical protein K438DRAFT_1833684 [Mycena galopus ATCC 62051]|nr:hypothetical protein K438DRAFT_1833684 [Mycena galopus ATCC 62051]